MKRGSAERHGQEVYEKGPKGGARGPVRAARQRCNVRQLVFGFEPQLGSLEVYGGSHAQCCENTRALMCIIGVPLYMYVV